MSRDPLAVAFGNTGRKGREEIQLAQEALAERAGLHRTYISDIERGSRMLKAMRTPRVTLLLADDVGLGKTVEAGLVMAELILQRRIQRILILTPASLRGQWQEEMRRKSCLNFEVVHRAQTQQLRRRPGLDAKPPLAD